MSFKNNGFCRNFKLVSISLYHEIYFVDPVPRNLFRGPCTTKFISWTLWNEIYFVNSIPRNKFREAPLHEMNFVLHISRNEFRATYFTK